MQSFKPSSSVKLSHDLNDWTISSFQRQYRGMILLLSASTGIAPDLLYRSEQSALSPEVQLGYTKQMRCQYSQLFDNYQNGFQASLQWLFATNDCLALLTISAVLEAQLMCSVEKAQALCPLTPWWWVKTFKILHPALSCVPFLLCKKLGKAGLGSHAQCAASQQSNKQLQSLNDSLRSRRSMQDCAEMPMSS